MFEEKIYHIYLKDRCIYHNLSKEDFDRTWDMIHRMVDMLDTKVNKEELQYVELIKSSEIARNSSY